MTRKIFFRPKIEQTSEEKRDLKDEITQTPMIENRELKVGSNLQLTNGNSEISIKESSFHHGVAVPLTLEEYEKEIAREKDLLNKAKKKIAMESSTPKDGISTWILLSGSNNPTTRPEMKPAFRIDPDEQKVTKNQTMTTKKRPITTTTTKMPKPTPKYNNNKLVTRVKVAILNETDAEVTTKASATTKKPQLTTKAKKYTTVRPKTTTTSTTTRAPTTAKYGKTTTTTEAVEIYDDLTEEQSPAPPVETATFLIMEAKDADFNLPPDRTPLKVSPTKKSSKSGASTKTKKKKIPVGSTNSTRIIKKKDKKHLSTKLSSKTPEKPFTTQIYNYLAREVMPTVGVGLVGLVVTAGLATYFLGGPLTALRRSYDISNRRDDVAFDRSDDFGNIQNEEEMFGKVIAGMPENSAYRNNIRVSSYRPKAQPYTGYQSYGSQQSPKYGNQQQLRYRTIDSYSGQNAYQNSYPQYYQQQIQAQTQSKSANVNEYSASQQQQVQQPQVQSQPAQTQQQNNLKYNVDSNSKFNIDTVDMTTNQPEMNYNIDYDELAQSYFPQPDQTQVSIEQQKMKEVESKPHTEASRSEKLHIVQAQSVPSNHRTENGEQNLPTPEALTYTQSDEEYQNSIANAIMNQNNQKQFVVGSVVAENFEENQPSIVPEHGPRRRRRNAVQKSAKSLEDNEIEDEEDKLRVEADSTTAKAEESSSHVEHSSETAHAEGEESSTQYTVTYNIDNPQNTIFDLFRRILDMKLRMGLNFLQNATLQFQHYLKGVEQRVNTSPMFKPPYMKNETVTSDARKNKNQPKAVDTL